MRTNVKGKSNIPTPEKVSKRKSQMVSPPLATLSGKTPISIPKAMRKKRKQYQSKDMEVGSDLWHKVAHIFEKDGFSVLEKTSNMMWKLKSPP